MIIPKPCLKSLTANTLLLLTIVVFTGCQGAKSSKPAKIPAPYESSPWATFLNNDARNNITADGVTLPLKVSWTRSAGEGGVNVKFINPPSKNYSSPSVAGGYVFAGSTRGELLALSLKKGKKLWRFETETPVDAPSTVRGNMVCFGTSGGTLYCLDKKTGAELWNYPVYTEILSAPIITADTVYFTSSDNRILALDASTGKKKWGYSRSYSGMVTTRFVNSPASSDTTIFTLFSDGELCAFNIETGKLRWSKQVLKETEKIHSARRTPLYHEGHVYVISERGSLLAFDAETGVLKVAYDVTNAVDFIISEKSVIISGDEELVSVDIDSGETLWDKQIQKGQASSIFSAGGMVFVISNQEKIPFNVEGLEAIKTIKGYIQAFSIRKGTLQWTEKLRSTVSANASAVKDHILIMTDSGRIITYSAK